MPSNTPTHCPRAAPANPRSRRPLTPAVLPALVCLLAAGANAGIVATYDFTQINQPIPDGDEFGLTDSRNITLDGPIQSLNVRLTIQGGYNGDFYVSLSHLDTTAVLLNRPGRRSNTGVAQYGYGDAGLQITLDDSAPNGDIHTYRLQYNLELPPDQRHSIPLGGPLTGLWAPDTRTADPAAVLVESPRTALLSTLNGPNAGGVWTLFAADLESGEEAELVSWGMDITVPEPRQCALLTAAGLVALALGRRGLAATVGRPRRLGSVETPHIQIERGENGAGPAAARGAAHLR